MKGQLTIEYVAILAVVLLMFAGITKVLMSDSLTYVIRSDTAELSNSARLLLNSTMNVLKQEGPGAERTIFVRAPGDCSMYASKTGLGQPLGLARMILYCPGKSYHGTVVYTMPSGPAWRCLTCANGTVSGYSYYVIGAGKVEPITLMQQ